MQVYKSRGDVSILGFLIRLLEALVLLLLVLARGLFVQRLPAIFTQTFQFKVMLGNFEIVFIAKIANKLLKFRRLNWRGVLAADAI